MQKKKKDLFTPYTKTNSKLKTKEKDIGQCFSGAKRIKA